eukprot:c17304_g1_i2 orf=281-559(-)
MIHSSLLQIYLSLLGIIIEGSRDEVYWVSDYATMMTAIFSMLEKDFQMQEKIVSALGLDTPSEPLQNYYLMWDLRPFIDERVVNEALEILGK